jgi:LacI family transcriptional regulator
MAVGALKWLRQAGRRVPEDIALVGFDDIPVASAIQPPLTTVRQPVVRLAVLAVEVLVNMLQRTPAEKSPPQRIVLTTELVVRESCGALR